MPQNVVSLPLRPRPIDRSCQEWTAEALRRALRLKGGVPIATELLTRCQACGLCDAIMTRRLA